MRRRPSTAATVALLVVAVLAIIAAVLVMRLADRPAGGITAEELAAGAEKALLARAGARPAVSCPDGLEAEAGATARCTLTSGNDPEEYGVSVAVTSVDGNRFTVAVEVDDVPVE